MAATAEARLTASPATAPLSPLANTIELTYLLARKTFKVRYKRAVLGVAWAVLQPAVQGAVLAIVFSRVITVGQGPHYPEYVLSGIFGWTVFAQALSGATTSVVDNDSLVKKVALPKVVFPLSSIGATLMAATASLPVLVIASIAAHSFSWRIIGLIPAMAAASALTAAISLFTSALYVAYRDMRYLVESALLLGMYVTPVVYDLNRVGHTLRTVLRCNPMTGVLDLYRWSVLGRPVDGLSIVVLLGVIAVLLVGGSALFRSRSDEFPDLL